MDLSDRKALVTGGTSGIGKAIASRLAEQGASVLIVGRDVEKGSQVQKELRHLGKHDRVYFLRADLSLIKDTKDLVAKMGADLAGLDYVVQSAGVIDFSDIRTAEGHNRMFAVNYLHRHVLANLLKPLLDASPDPRMVFVAAPVADSLMPDWENMEGPRVYDGLRNLPRLQAASLCLVQSLAAQWGPKVTVTAIHPGVVDTGIFRSAPWWLNLVKPLLRPMMSQPEQAGSLLNWLLTSPEARELNGFMIESPKQWGKRHKLARPQEALDRLEKLTQSLLKL